MITNAIEALKTARRQRRHWKSVWRGFKEFRKSGQTPEAAYQSMIALHCATNGYSNEFIHDLTCRFSPTKRMPHHRGVLGDLSAHEVKSVAQEIATKGYVVFPGRVPRLVCDALSEFARSNPAPITPTPAEGPTRDIFDPSSPRGQAYWFEEDDLMRAPVIQDLMCDHSIISIVQAYLKCLPVLDIVGMWWSAAQSSQKLNQGVNGQLYHFDMNRVKWLKVMIYLTDVDTDGGPHCFVEGSHLPGSQPKELLDRGYARIPDADIDRYYRKSQQRELVGPRGTILFADTRGFHKGKTPESHERLVVHLNYADSLFGAKFDEPTIPSDCVPELREALKNYPRMFGRYTLEEAEEVREERRAA